jgi:hypothetical protein
VSWEEPIERNGILEKYTIRWMPCDDCTLDIENVIPECGSNETVDWDDRTESAEVDTSTLNYLIPGLTPFSVYMVEVFANTSAGRGPACPFSVSTLTGSEFL